MYNPTEQGESFDLVYRRMFRKISIEAERGESQSGENGRPRYTQVTLS